MEKALIWFIAMAILKDIYKIVKINKKEFFEITEMISFGLVINAIYGVINSLNIKDIFVIIF